jgi:hypothetical protein
LVAGSALTGDKWLGVDGSPPPGSRPDVPMRGRAKPCPRVPVDALASGGYFTYQLFT